MRRTKSSSRSRAIPDTYFALVKRHPLTSIRNETELDAAQAVVDALLREDLDEGGRAYLDALSDLVIVYEQEHHAIAALPPHELLAQMLDERNMSQANLARATGLAKASVSDLVSGKRPFTVHQMHTVAKVFGLPGTVFMAAEEKHFPKGHKWNSKQSCNTPRLAGRSAKGRGWTL